MRKNETRVILPQKPGYLGKTAWVASLLYIQCFSCFLRFADFRLKLNEKSSRIRDGRNPRKLRSAELAEFSRKRKIGGIPPSGGKRESMNLWFFISIISKSSWPILINLGRMVYYRIYRKIIRNFLDLKMAPKVAMRIIISTQYHDKSRADICHQCNHAVSEAWFPKK